MTSSHRTYRADAGFFSMLQELVAALPRCEAIALPPSEATTANNSTPVGRPCIAPAVYRAYTHAFQRVYVCAEHVLRETLHDAQLIEWAGALKRAQEVIAEAGKPRVVQRIELPADVESLANTRRHRHELGKDKRALQGLVRIFLDTRGRRPSLPCEVKLIRCSQVPYEEGDNDGASFKYVRDTVARWIHGRAEVVAAKKAGRFVVDGRGKLKTTRPRAPDAQSDGISWSYGHEHRLGRPTIVIEITEAVTKP